MEVSDSEKLHKNKMSLIKNESKRKVTTNVLSNENRFGKILFHMVLVGFKKINSC